MNVAARPAPPVEALVLLPGLGADARLFEAQFDALARTRPVTMALPLGGERIDTIVAHILPHLPQRMALLGHGLGGVVALEILRRAPQRVARLALVGASPFLDTPGEAADREARMIALRAGRIADWVALEYAHAISDPLKRNALLAELTRMAEAMGVDALMAQSRAYLRRADTQGVLRRCACPIAVIGGDADPLCPSRRQDVMTNLAPDARLTRIAGTGHFPMLEAPEAFGAALSEFMQAPFVLR